MMAKNTELITRQTELSASLRKDLIDVISLQVDNAPAERVQRLSGRLLDAGEKSLLADMYKSVLAEQIYLLKTEEDWEFFLSPETNQPYSCWDEFHEKLIDILPISESSSWYYQKVVRYGYEVLELEKGQFSLVGGLTTVGKMLELSVVNGYDRSNWAKSVRPATENFASVLDKEFPEEDSDTKWQKQLKSFFQQSTLKHDYQDESAINPPARELNQMVDDLLGRPSVWWVEDGQAIKWCISYPSGEIKTGRLVPQEPIPPPVMTDMVKGLRIKEDGGITATSSA